ncbi:MAG: glycerol-3-phosphate 1-O-acyltransferase PlsY [Clostridium sp.]
MIIILAILGYLMGSIPTGYILVKKNLHIDIREHGSGNIGATNVGRVAGKRLGLITTILDMAKAMIPVIITDILLKLHVIDLDRSLALTMVGVCAILGHNYTIFLKFKGGKGVATTIAAFAYIIPIPLAISVAFFLGLKKFTKIVSIRSMVLGTVLFLSTLLLGYEKNYIIGSFIACILIFWRHKSNIGRILRGEEK